MTIDKRRAVPRAGQLPAFAPVPRQCQRHDGWTEERQRRFIEALADTGSVKAAAHRVNMTPEGAYMLRRHPEGASFRKAWEAALALGVQQLEDIAMERALHGTEVPVYSYGKLIGSRVVHNDRLVMFLLRNRAPARFAADGRVTARRGTLFDPAEANRLSRLKKQWRKEWEEERAAKARRASEAVLAGLHAKLQRMADNHAAAMSERTRALYRAWQEAAAEDECGARIGRNGAAGDREVAGEVAGDDESGAGFIALIEKHKSGAD
ncbi:hypothetical protein B0I00_0976 [Novosphingobium kunmingense]|uniref:Terminase small subunit n=1 Tax=Novosphingobium kunmingense TaxID=1211806 RepID=A0A2N0I3K8_9SPHN|nr:hypothetical protein [Novosphingobium kunmingense]PKB25769.1 hypothetical protein B0I00_0976 [Novosphingobium kunmingense]